MRPARPPQLHKTFAIAWIALVVVRLPTLLAPRLGLDGDESLLGLMAIALLERGDLPVFAAGQQYGLSTVEVVVASIAFALASPSTTALRAAMLCLWSVGGAAMVVAVHGTQGRRAAIAAAALMATCPAWLDWAWRARGGYLTAFVFAQVALTSILLKRPRSATLRYALLGGCAALVAFAQPLWGALLAPVALLALAREPQRRAIGAAVVALIVIAAAVLGMRDEQDLWFPSQTLLSLGDAAASAPSRLLSVFEGHFIFDETLPVGVLTTVAATTWLAALVAVFVAARRPPVEDAPLWRSLVAGMALVLVATLPLDLAFGPRYLLPLPAVVTLLVVWAVFGGAHRSRAAGVALGLLVLASSLAYLDALRGPSPTVTHHPLAYRQADLDELVVALEEGGHRHVLTLEVMLPGPIMFCSGGAVAARARSLRDRLPYLSAPVTTALERGEPMALVVHPFEVQRVLPALTARGRSPSVTRVNERFVIVAPLGGADAAALGFVTAR